MSPEVVPDFITSFHLNPLENGTILLTLLAKSLHPESLVRSVGQIQHMRRVAEKKTAVSPKVLSKLRGIC